MQLRIGIAGTRGIPNHYGGFEQFASHLSEELVKRGHAVTVYNTSHHPYQAAEWNGVQIVHKKDAGQCGTAGQFLYDLACIRDARKQNFDVLLMLGYTSSSLWGRWYPHQTVVVTNMDGMEWKRSKFNWPVRLFLRYAERLAVKYSYHCVADSTAIKTYLEHKYRTDVSFIAYGSDVPESVNDSLLSQYRLSPRGYHLLIARMEPENHIETILDGLQKRDDGMKIVVVSNTGNAFGKYIRHKFHSLPGIVFTGALFDRPTLDALRRHCSLYFHGHSVGGTNPSLLEAMAAGAWICAHDNLFNRAVLGVNAYWFSSSDDIARLQVDETDRNKWTQQNLDTIRTSYQWKSIVDAYETLFLRLSKAN